MTTPTVALVTGGARGIGEACARRLAEAGHVVVVADRDTGGAESVAAALRADGHEAVAAPVDVRDVDAVDDLVDTVVARNGRLAVAVNNAGTGAPWASVADLELAAWHRTLDVNLHGLLHCLRAEVRAMRDAGLGGAIVNMGSVMSVRGTRLGSPYVASKHAVLGLTRAAALDHAEDGIRVNLVAPGFVRTELLERGLDADQQAEVTGRHPIGRLATPDDVAAVVAFLLSADADNVTGACWGTDGGYTIA